MDNMANEEFKIGDLAKAFGMSVESLRYYGKIGLLSSTREENNYRSFNMEQLCSMLTVSSLRSVGAPIKSVNSFVQSENLYNVFECLEDASRKLDQEMDELLQKRKTLNALSLLWQEMRNQDNVITVRTSPQWWATFVHDDLQVVRALTIYHALYEKSFGRIQFVYMADKDRLEDGELVYGKFALVSDTPISGDALPVEIWESKLCAHILFVGERAEIPTAYHRLHYWIKEHHYMLCGNIVEIYLINNLNQFAIELWAPIQSLK